MANNIQNLFTVTLPKRTNCKPSYQLGDNYVLITLQDIIVPLPNRTIVQIDDELYAFDQENDGISLRDSADPVIMLPQNTMYYINTDHVVQLAKRLEIDQEVIIQNMNPIIIPANTNLVKISGHTKIHMTITQNTQAHVRHPN